MKFFPLSKENIFVTNDTESFRNRDFLYDTEIPVGNHVGAFAAVRKHDIHSGVDLYCNESDLVWAIEGGVITKMEYFTGDLANSPWWNETKAVHIEGESGVIVYGEIEPLPKYSVGSKLMGGELIGFVKRVLKSDKGRPTTMLHIELYKHGSRTTCEWHLDKTKNPDLLDPTKLLIEVAKHDLKDDIEEDWFKEGCVRMISFIEKF